MKHSNDTISHQSYNASAQAEKLYDSTASRHSPTRLEGDAMPTENTEELSGTFRDTARDGLVFPNCGNALEGRKCKLFCHTPGCGYLVTCSEW